MNIIEQQYIGTTKIEILKTNYDLKNSPRKYKIRELEKAPDEKI